MIDIVGLSPPPPCETHQWVGMVLDQFARGEQAIGRLSVAVGLPISSGSLGSLKQLREKLIRSGDCRANRLDQSIARWQANRPFRHLLAHATLTILFDGKGRPVLVTRHLPRDVDDVTPDRLWTQREQQDLLKHAKDDGNSICDLIRNIVDDPALMKNLRAP